MVVQVSNLANWKDACMIIVDLEYKTKLGKK